MNVRRLKYARFLCERHRDRFIVNSVFDISTLPTSFSIRNFLCVCVRCVMSLYGMNNPGQIISKELFKHFTFDVKCTFNARALYYRQHKRFIVFSSGWRDAEPLVERLISIEFHRLLLRFTCHAMCDKGDKEYNVLIVHFSLNARHLARKSNHHQ